MEILSALQVGSVVIQSERMMNAFTNSKLKLTFIVLRVIALFLAIFDVKIAWLSAVN